MLRRARLGYEERGIRPLWMGENVFKEMLVYWKSDEFKKKSEKAKQRRASERGAANHRAGSISIADHAERMAVAKRRAPLMQELHERTYRGRDGEYCDDRARDTQAEYKRLKKEFLAKHPELGGPHGRYPLDPAIDQYLWLQASKGKKRNGKIYATGPLASNYKKGDRYSLFRRIADGEGSSRPPTLTPEITETIKQLAQSEAARENETLRKKQMELEEALRLSQEQMMLTQQQIQQQVQQQIQQQMQQQMQQMQQFFRQQYGGGGFGAGGNQGVLDENDEENENNADDPDPK
ncbi:uncharacterized protein LOC131640248 [Vicia villosa]|uniref:uncharacterized protein LOC131640248 n=1 Tax=Vicia villosa TaxID=3911 RepID=UPI00273AC118|nr:uncharacterized protein LOC131640248 [Vicia villosa]